VRLNFVHTDVGYFMRKGVMIVLHDFSEQAVAESCPILFFYTDCHDAQPVQALQQTRPVHSERDLAVSATADVRVEISDGALCWSCKVPHADAELIECLVKSASGKRGETDSDLIGGCVGDVFKFSEQLGEARP